MTARLALVSAISAIIAALAAGSARAATPSITTYWNGCPAYSGLQVCTGQVPSFDGAHLDVDLTLPAGPAPGDGTGHPLVVMLHGFGNDKHEWESTADTGDGGDKWHWNSAWFAHHGFYVLTYTARGFRSSAASRADEPATPAGTSVDPGPPHASGTIHLKSREFEARDTQWLAAMVAHA
jgi:hypothetical protein